MILLFAVMLGFAGITFGLIALFCIWLLVGPHQGPVVYLFSAPLSTRGVIAFLALAVLASSLAFTGLHFLWKKADRRPFAG
jgi:hypothetical protein